jgi:hypothetical protein
MIAPMTVTQPGARAISIRSDTGLELLVPYVFHWNGHERPAESIVLTAGARRGAAAGPCEVRAFFLFGEIRDLIQEAAGVVTVRRTWLVKTHGAVHLSLDLELAPPAGMRVLFPGVHAATGAPDAALSFLGEKTSVPSGLVLSLDGKGVLVFSPSTVCGGSRASIGVSRPEGEEASSRLRVQVRFPGVEEPAGRVGPRPDDVQESADEAIESPGSLERTHELCFYCAPSAEILLRGPAAVLGRLAPRAAVKAQPRAAVDKGALAEALHKALTTHLLQKGGVAGMRETPDSSWLSSTAGLGCAIAMRRLFPGDARLHELALRLADFTLKGQLPSGFFHECYNLETGRWRGVHGRQDRTLLSAGQSSRIAELLLILAADLARDGCPAEKYWLAGLRFVEFFLDEKGRLSMPGSLHAPAERAAAAGLSESLGGLELFFPAAAVLERTGRDRHKKTMDALVKRFSQIRWDAYAPPCSREGRGPDAAGALLATRLFVAMRAGGYRPVEPPVSSAKAAAARSGESARLFASLLVPWIRVHADGTGEEPAPDRYCGCLVDSFARQRLLFCGFETSLRLRELAPLVQEPGASAFLASLSRLCLDSTAAAPLGTAFVQHTMWDSAPRPGGARTIIAGMGRGGTAGASRRGAFGAARGRLGPIDSRRLASEVLAALRLAEVLPKA